MSAATPREKLPPGQRCQVLEATRCESCGNSLQRAERCTLPATNRYYDWWTCAAHRESGIKDANMIGRD